MVKGAELVDTNFEYVSDSNDQWMSVGELRAWISGNLGDSSPTFTGIV